MTPERSDLILATNIPDSEADILVFNRLHVEPCKHKAEPLSLFCLDEKSRNPPIVGIVVTISPSFNLYNIVVFPAASRPTRNIDRSDEDFTSKLTHQDPHLLLPEEPAKETGDGETHDDVTVSQCHGVGSEILYLYDSLVEIDDTITV